MIYDTMKNAGLYLGQGKLLDQAFELIASGKIATLPEGHNEICGDDLFVNVMAYRSKVPDNLRFEAHRKYIDIHVLIEGEEHIAVSPIGLLFPDAPYDEGADCAFLAGKTQCLTRIDPQSFLLCLPDDAHIPGIRVDNEIAIRKAVIKVRV